VAIYLFVINHTWQGAFMVAWGILVLGIADNVVRFMLAKKWLMYILLLLCWGL
jgi:predicted PurR-regulated permease PerM